jgi:DNA-binding NarL/FixJ family response regulator
MWMKRLLLVDDNPLFREALALLLESNMGLDSVQAGSVAEARQLLDNLGGKVDLAIVDLDLPEGDAIELIEDLRELEVPVVVFTAGSNLEGPARAFWAGAGEVLSTATSGEEIVGAVRRLLSG